MNDTNTPKRNVQVNQKLNELDNSIEQVTKKFSELKERLDCVLSSTKPIMATGTLENKPSELCSIASSIDSKVKNINCLSYDITNLIDRLEI
jgi:archaellum component FlaC